MLGIVDGNYVIIEVKNIMVRHDIYFDAATAYKNTVQTRDQQFADEKRKLFDEIWKATCAGKWEIVVEKPQFIGNEEHLKSCGFTISSVYSTCSCSASLNDTNRGNIKISWQGDRIENECE